MKRCFLNSSIFIALMFFFVTPSVNAQFVIEDTPDYCKVEDFNSPNCAYGRGTGQSRDREISRDRAHSNALKNLAGALKTEIKGYVDDLLRDESGSGTDEFGDAYDDVDIAKKTDVLTKRVIELYARNVKLVCEKTIIKKFNDGHSEYETFQMLEYDKTDLKKQCYALLKKQRKANRQSEFERMEAENNSIWGN